MKNKKLQTLVEEAIASSGQEITEEGIKTIWETPKTVGDLVNILKKANQKSLLPIIANGKAFTNPQVQVMTKDKKVEIGGIYVGKMK